MRAFFSSYGPVEWVFSIKNKLGIATSDFEVLVTLTQPKINEVPNIITCSGGNIFVVVESYCPYCWICSAARHLAKLGVTRNPAPTSQPTPEQPRVVAAKRPPSGPGEWMEVVEERSKDNNSASQAGCPSKATTAVASKAAATATATVATSAEEGAAAI